jgi:hypothetical protein
MLISESIRASDQARDAAVGVLRDAYVAGQLDLDELRDRAGAVYRARTCAELRRLTADLRWELLDSSLGGPQMRVPKPERRAAGQRFALMLLAGLMWVTMIATLWLPVAVFLLLVVTCAAMQAIMNTLPSSGSAPGKGVAHPRRPHELEVTGRYYDSLPPGRMRGAVDTTDFRAHNISCSDR